MKRKIKNRHLRNLCRRIFRVEKMTFLQLLKSRYTRSMISRAMIASSNAFLDAISEETGRYYGDIFTVPPELESQS